MNWISIDEACKLLGISRPTFNERRREFALSEWKVGRRIKFSKSEILKKIILPPIGKDDLIDLTAVDDAKINDLQIDESTYDLRKINTIDPYGAISLLCSIISNAGDKKEIHLITDDSASTRRLFRIGFFDEIERTHKKYVSWDKRTLEGLEKRAPTETFLPLRQVTYKGGERRLALNLIKLLKKQGFSETIGGYIAWILGELADNSHTHAKGSCYLMVERFEKKHKYLAIGVGDTGVGVHKSLKENPKHKALLDHVAFPLAFKSRITSWGDEFNRGKGLTDVLKIALGNNAFLRADSGSHGLMMTFAGEKRIIRRRPPATTAHGTRYCLVLIDHEFADVSTEQADKIIDDFLGGE